MLGIFNGSALPVDPAIRLLEIEPNYQLSIFGGNLESLTNDLIINLRNTLDTTLEEGGLTLIHIDKNGKTFGDHWLVVHSRLAGNFIATDPATGASILFSRDSLTATSGKNSAPYIILEALSVFNK